MKVGILSNIHDNIAKLQDAINALRNAKCESVVCLGDMVGSTIPHCLHYFNKRDSTGVLHMIQKYCDLVVVGNHDLNSVARIPKYTADFKYPKGWAKFDYYSKKEHSKGKIWLYENELPTLLNRQDRIYLIGLPEVGFKNYDDIPVMFSHYAYPDVTGSTSITYRNPKYLQKHFRYMDIHHSKISFSGHEHENGLRLFTEKEVITVPFDEELQLDIEDNINWITGPAVCTHKDATFKDDIPNGVMVFDTKKLTVKAIQI